MALQQSNSFQQIQRVQVGIDGQPSTAKRIKISVENYDEGLGWYSAGSLTLPMHQLPLLEQALHDLRRQQVSEEPANDVVVIPFPGLRVLPQA